MTKNARRQVNAAVRAIMEAAEEQLMGQLFEDQLNHDSVVYTEEQVDEIITKLADIATAMHEAAK